MNRLEKLLKELKSQNKKVLSVFLTVGYPNIKTTEKLIIELEKYVDIIELGIPFSDPIADGPTIQYSSQKALENGTNIHQVFDIIKNVRQKSNIPIAIMGYLNPIYNFGLNKFFQQLKKCPTETFGNDITGVDGLIIPDMPSEESNKTRKLAKKYKIAYIPLVALTTEKNRALKIANSSTGFVYVTAVTGITGVREKIDSELIPFLKTLSAKTSKPLFVGFGISKPEHIQKLKKYCDGFIIGSAVIEQIRQKKSVINFVKSLKTVLNNF
ncbi:MAG: tryptophan synthase subunit alpha [Elusimicrobiota bacterium]